MREDYRVNQPAKRIKVVQIIARMNVGGPAVIVADLMRGLDSTQFEQILITGYCDSNEADYLETVATDIIATRIAGLGRSVSPIADLRAFFSLVRTIKEIQPDVIHTHTAKAGVLGRLAAILAGGNARRIHTFHGHLLHGYFAGWKVRLVVAIEKFFAARTNVLIAVGNQVKQDLLSAGIGKVDQYVVIYPGLPIPHTQQKDSLRSQLNLDTNSLYCIFVGRLTQIKRPDRLLDIATYTKQKGSKLHYLVAGEGELFSECQERARRENLPVTFLGWRKDTDRLFAASDIALLTSDNEGIPLTLIEASLAGLPVVATNVGSIADIVRTDVTGILTETEPTQLAEALLSLEKDSKKRSAMGEAAKAHATQYFSLAKSLNDHAILYKNSQDK